MHAALLANSAWLDDELTAFQQLTVGLVDEQVRLTRVLPTAVGGSGLGMGDSSLLGKRITWAESRLAAVNHRRLVKLCDALDADGVDLLHALHGDLWQPAMVVGDQLDLPVVFTANSAADVRQAGKLVKQLNPTRCVFTATTEPIAEDLRLRTQNLVRVETVVPGVHVGDPKLHQRTAGGEEAPCVAVCGDGNMDDQYQQFLEGVRLVVDDHPEMQFFFDGQLTDQHQLWRAVKKMDLLGNASFVPRRRGHREMLLMADAIVHPQELGRARGVTLLAMAHAVPVLAAADEMLDYLVPDHTAWVVEEPDAEAWADVLLRLVRAPDAAADLGMRSRAWVHEERLASDQIARTLMLYRGMAGEPLPFAG
ncbi:MAG: glycosyltransferase [Planctomycetota bacterium]